jgi:hypothetical protein
MKHRMWSQLLWIGGFLLAWFALQRFVLPALGVRT